ncbi:metal-dependent hydrolase, partial [Streptomyces sp. NPDC006324]|uniref:metal-dependent hydrolase n=1 Tax=Streptomyces sp. NPDC006324 TaxID=3156751 RepID=UPI0033A01813
MMGPAHSLSGAAAWLGAGALAAAYDRPMPWPVLVVGALICAGAALAPDLDHKSATISRSFGPLSKILCGIIDKLSYAVYKATRSKADPRRIAVAEEGFSHHDRPVLTP